MKQLLLQNLKINTIYCINNRMLMLEEVCAQRRLFFRPFFSIRIYQLLA
jgi:hypothetical protein